MDTQTKENNTEGSAREMVQPVGAPIAPAAPAATPGSAPKTPFAGSHSRDFKKNTRRPARRESRVKPEFDQKIISIRRVARVVTGGRRFSFSVALVAGNRKGQVGVGLGKAGDTSLAIEKAFRDAKKNMITVNMTKNQSVPHEVSAKFSSSVVTIMPAPDRGVIAGSSARIILELAGVKDVGGKVRSGSKNKLNIARATLAALEKLPKSREKVAAVAAGAVSAPVVG